MKIRSQILIIAVSIFIFGCLSGQPEEELVYFNNFEQESRLEGASEYRGSITFSPEPPRKTSQYNGSTVLGNFGTGSVYVELYSLPQHDYIKIEFDLFIHDKWEGNGTNNQADVFILSFDQTTLYYSSIINSKCLDRNCELRQSFPAIINQGNNPENAFVEDPSLPGICHWAGEKGGTKKIRITEFYPHSVINSRIQIAADIKNNDSENCLKSWSIDNIEIRTVTIPDL